MVRVTWSSAAPPGGYVFDVKIKRPASSYVTWQSGVSTLSASVVPDAGVGTYSFRARLRNANGRSGWSPKVTIQVS